MVEIVDLWKVKILVVWQVIHHEADWCLSRICRRVEVLGKESFTIYRGFFVCFSNIIIIHFSQHPLKGDLLFREVQLMKPCRLGSNSLRFLPFLLLFVYQTLCPLRKRRRTFLKKGPTQGNSSRARNGKSSLTVNNPFKIFLIAKNDREPSKKFIYSSTRLILKKSQSFLNSSSIPASLLKIESLSINLTFQQSKKVIRTHF